MFWYLILVEPHSGSYLGRPLRRQPAAHAGRFNCLGPVDYRRQRRLTMKENSMSPVTLVLLVAVLALAVWFAWTCLADLAQTSDDQLALFPKMAWAVLIVVTIPLGGLLYLIYGKGPRRPA